MVEIGLCTINVVDCYCRLLATQFSFLSCRLYLQSVRSGKFHPAEPMCQTEMKQTLGVPLNCHLRQQLQFRDYFSIICILKSWLLISNEG